MYEVSYIVAYLLSTTTTFFIPRVPIVYHVHNNNVFYTTRMVYFDRPHGG